MPEGFLKQNYDPEATTSIIIGRLDAGCREAAFPGQKAVLWITDSTEAEFAPANIPPDQLHPLCITPQSIEAVIEALEKFCLIDPRNIPSLYITQAAHTCEAVLPEILAHLSTTQRTRLTRQQDAFTWQRQLLQNLPHWLSRRLPVAWEGALEGIPANIIGAGPSIDHTGPLIAQSPGIVISADSALHRLQQLGLQPDFIVSTDAFKTPENCLPESHTARRVILSSISPPNWTLPQYGTETLFITGRQITEDWIATLGLAPTPFASTESCGSTALELARFLGCSPIHLFGIDLAANPDAPGQIRSEAIVDFEHQKNQRTPETVLPRVPGNFHDEVQTHVLPDLHALNARLANWPVGLVLNINDRGAKLANTPAIHPDQFQPALCPADLSTRLDSLAPPDNAAAQLQTACAAFQLIGQAIHEQLTPLRTQLHSPGPDKLAETLRGMWAQDEIAQAFGAWSLKLFPHLVPPINRSIDFWGSLLGEMEVLAQRMRSIRES